MARRTTQPPPPRRSAVLTADEIRAGIDRLQRRLDDVRKFEPTSVTEQMNIPHVEALSASIEEALVRTFGPDTLDYERYKSAKDFGNDPFNYAYEVPIQAVQQSLARSKASSSALLKQAIRSLNEQAHERASAPSPTANLPFEAPKAPSKDVFIVHGHDEGARETVARFLQTLSFNPIILHEKASRGRTIIEKVEAHRDVGFAVILLTVDDIGKSKGRGRAAAACTLECHP